MYDGLSYFACIYYEFGLEECARRIAKKIGIELSQMSLDKFASDERDKETASKYSKSKDSNRRRRELEYDRENKRRKSERSSIDSQTAYIGNNKVENVGMKKKSRTDQKTLEAVYNNSNNNDKNSNDDEEKLNIFTYNGSKKWRCTRCTYIYSYNNKCISKHTQQICDSKHLKLQVQQEKKRKASKKFSKQN